MGIARFPWHQDHPLSIVLSVGVSWIYSRVAQRIPNSLQLPWYPPAGYRPICVDTIHRQPKVIGQYPTSTWQLSFCTQISLFFLSLTFYKIYLNGMTRFKGYSIIIQVGGPLSKMQLPIPQLQLLLGTSVGL